MEGYENRDNKKSEGKISESPSTRRYMGMSEKEKELEIQKAVTRLQNRIGEILYLLEMETKTEITNLKKQEQEVKKKVQKSEQRK